MDGDPEQSVALWLLKAWQQRRPFFGGRSEDDTEGMAEFVARQTGTAVQEEEEAVPAEGDQQEEQRAKDERRRGKDALFTAAKRAQRDLVVQGQSTRVVFSIWDYGGQPIFHCLHPLFLSRFGVYFVVFNLADMVGGSRSSSSCEVRRQPQQRVGMGKEECLEVLRFWLSTVAVHGQGAPLMLVGTHKDQVSVPLPLALFC